MKPDFPFFPAVVAGSILALSSASPASACSQLFSSVMSFVAFPADRARDVPLNVTPLLPGGGPDVAARTGLRLETDDGTAVEAGVVAVDVAGVFEIQETLLRIVPLAPLSPQTSYRIVDDAGPVSTFTTGDDRDDDVPEAPAVDVTELVAPDPDSTGFECSFDGSATVVVEAEAGVLVIAAFGSDPSLDGVLRGASLTETLTVFSGEPITARYAVVDLAGHVSPATEVELGIPPPVGCGGCSSSSFADLSAWALVLLGLLRPLSGARSARFRRASAP